MFRTIGYTALGIAALLMLFQLSHLMYFSGRLDIELLTVVLAIVFAGGGLLIGRMFRQRHANPALDADLISSRNGVMMEGTGISTREQEVLVLMGEGLSNREIGQRLFVSENTVKTHVSNLLVKLHARRRTEAVRKALERGLIV